VSVAAPGASGCLQAVRGAALPTHAPALHASVGVQRRPSSHDVPSATTVPAQPLAPQTSPLVHGLPSSHAAPGVVHGVRKRVAVAWYVPLPAARTISTHHVPAAGAAISQAPYWLGPVARQSKLVAVGGLPRLT